MHSFTDNADLDIVDVVYDSAKNQSTFWVVNGAWQGTYDHASKEAWPNNYPEYRRFVGDLVETSNA